MKSTVLLVLATAGLFTACTSSRDELRRTAPNTVPVPHNTIVDCPVYDGMTKTSNVLVQTTAGNTVQVLDTINAYFVRVRLEKAGLVQTGYMDRRCFGVRGDK
ncbi:hypothetical protein [Hymenobacter convexus]|uniref:hypothetical protein n=1 Tax=Hymenobacter sp. CA1UV-4 TaxID=3063782 RepID=UPI0027138E72|nr:hypothetical protein [Hymenobacter sp. CA1UV-4]MDO7850096.1 hypothetical protein [Hymenobacter sp. CA1UV-4]